MVKVGFRTPSIKRSIKARTTGRVTRSVKKYTSPGYGRKGAGLIKNPKKSVYNAVYHRTTASIFDVGKTSTTSKRSTTPSTNSNTSHEAAQAITTRTGATYFPDLHYKIEQTGSVKLGIVDVQQETLDKLIEYSMRQAKDAGAYFDRLTNSEITENHFNEKVYQLGNISRIGASEITWETPVTDIVEAFIEIDGQRLLLGTLANSSKAALKIALDHSPLSKTVTTISGGPYKIAVYDDEGYPVVRRRKDPYTVEATFQSFKKVDTHEEEAAADKAIQDQITRNQNNQSEPLSSSQSCAIGCGCFSITLLIIISLILSAIH